MGKRKDPLIQCMMVVDTNLFYRNSIFMIRKKKLEIWNFLSKTISYKKPKTIIDLKWWKRDNSGSNRTLIGELDAERFFVVHKLQMIVYSFKDLEVLKIIRLDSLGDSDEHIEKRYKYIERYEFIESFCRTSLLKHDFAFGFDCGLIINIRITKENEAIFLSQQRKTKFSKCSAPKIQKLVYSFSESTLVAQSLEGIDLYKLSGGGIISKPIRIIDLTRNNYEDIYSIHNFFAICIQEKKIVVCYPKEINEHTVRNIDLKDSKMNVAVYSTDGKLLNLFKVKNEKTKVTSMDYAGNQQILIGRNDGVIELIDLKFRKIFRRLNVPPKNQAKKNKIVFLETDYHKKFLPKRTNLGLKLFQSFSNLDFQEQMVKIHCDW